VPIDEQNHLTLVADIGGTNIRFGVAKKMLDKIEISNNRSFACSDFDSFEAALATYLDGLDCKPPVACLAVAGPVQSNAIQMTNLPWAFSASGLEKKFGFDQVDLINDFAAQACAVPAMGDQDLLQIKNGQMVPGAAKGVLGPGTGLGVATLVSQGGNWHPLSGEGGHVTLPVRTPYESELMKVIIENYRLDYVSAETILCGQGLVTLYKAMATLQGKTSLDYRPRDITSRFNEDALVFDTLTVFTELLANTASNLAVTVGARGGVYLAGGILPRIRNFLINSPFTNSFISKGPMSHYLEKIPVNLLINDNPALLGAAVWVRK